MIQVDLKLVKIIFENRNNNFRVGIFEVISSDSDLKKEKNIIVAGKMPPLDGDWLYQCKIEKSNNNKYPNSYSLIHCNKKPYVDIKNIVNFFLSNKFKGIGKKAIDKLIEVFGQNVIVNLMSDPNIVDQTSLSILQKNSIKDYFSKMSIQDEIFQLFMLSGLSEKKLIICLNYFAPAKLKEILNSNPYILMYSIETFTFIDCDKLVNYLKLSLKNNDRLKAIIYDCIKKELFKTGNTFLEKNKLFLLVILRFQLNTIKFQDIINEMYSEKLIHIYDSEKITIISYYLAEEYISLRLKQIMLIEKEHYKINLNHNIKFNKQQVNAINHSLYNSFTIITGSPGTGKTTIIKEIIHVLAENKIKNYVVLAPTGKAAKQLSLKTKVNAKTIHKFLEYNDNNTFDVNENNPSNIEILIIDEFSMVDTLLFYNLLLGLPKLKKIILVGDRNQLPSISPGYLLNDFMNWLPNNIINLDKIYRQLLGSNIISDAILVKDGHLPKLNSTESKFINLNNDDFSLLLNQIKNIFNKWSINDVQLLSPMYRGVFGINNLNLQIQKELMSKSKPVKIGKREHFIGDKIIQTINSSNYNVFNGEIGYIVSITQDNKIINVEFENDNKIVSYTQDDFLEMTKLAYAISVHKSQGSEFDIVVFIVKDEHKFLLDKKILYTGITRASTNLILIGNWNAIEYATRNDKHSFRSTMLNYFLSQN